VRAEKRVLRAVEQAEEILARYVEPGARNCEKTINELLEVLDDRKVVSAVWDLNPAAKPKDIEDGRFEKEEVARPKQDKHAAGLRGKALEKGARRFKGATARSRR
jgi:hypothetical protein